MRACVMCFVLVVVAGCMKPPKDVPGWGEQPDTMTLTRDYVGVGERLPDDELFESGERLEAERTGDAMYPGTTRSPEALEDRWPRKFSPDGTGLEAPITPSQN